MPIERQAGVYAIVQKSTGKRYIGSSENLKKREYDHFRDLKLNEHRNSRLQGAWNKYGANDFYWAVIVYTQNLDELLKLEQAWIDFYQATTRKHGFNISIFAGAAAKGLKHTPETRAKISAAGRRPCSDETKTKISAANKGKTISLERRAHLSKINTGLKVSEKTKEKLSLMNKGRVFPPEFGRKISASKMGHIVSDETREKISLAKKGQKLTVGAKINMSKSRMGHPAYNAKLNPEKVYTIKSRLANGISLSKIGKEFDICVATGSAIRNGRTWAHVIYP